MKEFTPEGANSLLLKLIPIDKESMKIKLELIPFKTIHFKIDTYWQGRHENQTRVASLQD